MLLIAVVVVALGVGGLFVARAMSAPSVVRGTVQLPNLPWPGEGQAAAEVEGLGTLGTSGTQTPVPIASVTKVMTAYVVLRDHPLTNDDGPSIQVDVQAQDEAQQAKSTEESTVPVVAGQRFTERQLLAAMLIPSGNNIARLLARWDAGSQDAFVRKMNQMAASLGMWQTTYTGASGVEASTMSTATDQLILARAAMTDDAIRTIVSERSTRIPGIPGNITNTNTLLGQDGIVGLKTGSTSEAGGALMWAAYANSAKGPKLVLGVVLYQQPGGSPNAGLAAALAASQKLVEGIESALPAMS
ncbi:MAG TPA: D-alanyl-D-alanine carboxypeptidase [Pseudonocardiaceae bacterium]|nr:D-alanyl-D-alanine carboxypeptidase [Pseudonocardiaceae bacterium]